MYINYIYIYTISVDFIYFFTTRMKQNERLIWLKWVAYIISSNANIFESVSFLQGKYLRDTKSIHQNQMVTSEKSSSKYEAFEIIQYNTTLLSH